MFRPRVLLLLTLLMLFAIPSLAQLPAQTPAATPTPEAPNPLEPEAFKLLEDIAKRLPTLKSRANRMSISCDVADLIWDRDEKRARTLFEDVTSDFSSQLATLDFTSPSANNEASLLYQQRQQLVERIANRDPELAISFLRATRSPFDLNGNFDPGSERNQEAHLAGLIALRDPQTALRVARSSLSRGVSHNLVNILVRLKQKDPAAAQTFFREVVDRIGADDMASNQEALNVATQLLSGFQPPQADEQTYRQLAETLTSRALAASPTDGSRVQLAQSMFHQLRGVMPLIEKYIPSRVVSLQQWFRAVERTFDASSRRYNELSELTQKASIEEMLAAAPRFPPDIQLQLYHQVIWKALNAGEVERARTLASDLITDPARRAQMMSQIDQHMLWKAVSESKVTETRRLVNTVKEIDRRIQLYVQLAWNLSSKGDKAAALQVLEEARAALVDAPSGGPKLNAQLQLARSFAELDRTQSVSLLQTAITQVNQLVGAASVLDGFENRYLTEGEWLPQSYTGLSHVVNGVQQAVAHLGGRKNPTNNTEASDDAVKRFADANRLAQQLERPEIQMQTQVQLARAALKEASARQPVRVSTGRHVQLIQ